MSITLQWGAASQAGRKTRNEDAWQVVLPQPPLPQAKGLLLLLADGVSDSADGKLAAEESVRAIAAAYYTTPDTWDVKQSFERLLAVQNRWLLAQPKQPLLTTMTALVLHGQRFTVASVGDSRAYRLRKGTLEQLSVDHTWNQNGLRHVLKRALGLDDHVIADFAEGEMQIHDRYVLICDGVWDVLSDRRLCDLLLGCPQAQNAADLLIEAALTEGSGDNVTALVADVMGMPTRTLADELAGLSKLPVPQKLRPGELIDGLTIESLWRKSRGSLLYRVIDSAGERWLLKTLPARLADDEAAQQGLMIEEWLLRGLGSPHFTEVAGRLGRTSLYLLVREYQGATLAERAQAGEAWSIAALLPVAIWLVKALGLLHRRNILHRDIKPDNIHLGSDGRLRLLDFASACCPGVMGDDAAQPGTPSFIAPEMFAGHRASRQTDLYAAGVTLYWMLTRHYPYGEIEAFQNPHFTEPITPTRYRPDLPAWLEDVLLKAVARVPEQRFQTAEEMVLALERGESHALERRQVPLLERDPLKLWQTVGVVSLIVNLILLYLFLLRH